MKSILCIVHVFYPEFWPELASCLRNIGEPFDLVVTYVDDSKGIPEMVLADFPSARLILCENKGFDIWPFLKALQSVKFEDYSIMVKLHTKRDVKRDGRPLVFNHCNFAESAWREYLLGFIRDRESWLATKARLSMDGVGMVADRHVIMNRSDTPWFKTRRSMDAAVEFVERLYGAPVAGVRFVAGTMFAARPRVFSKLVSRGWTADDFSESVRDGTEQTAHLLERVLGAIVSAEGLHIDSPRGDLTRWRFCASARDNLAAFMRFLWSDERVGGRRIVKVFGISLYRSGGKAAIPAREDCVVIDPPENPLDYADVLRAYVLREAARRAGGTARVIGAAPCHVPLFSGNIVRAVRTRRFLRKYVKPAVGLPPEGARRADAGPDPIRTAACDSCRPELVSSRGTGRKSLFCHFHRCTKLNLAAARDFAREHGAALRFFADDRGSGGPAQYLDAVANCTWVMTDTSLGRSFAAAFAKPVVDGTAKEVRSDG